MIIQANDKFTNMSNSSNMSNYRSKVMVVPYFKHRGRVYVLLVKHVPKDRSESPEWTCICGGAPNIVKKHTQSERLSQRVLCGAFRKEFQQETRNCVPYLLDTLCTLTKRAAYKMVNAEVQAYNNAAVTAHKIGENVMYKPFITTYHPKRFRSLTKHTIVSYYHLVYIEHDIEDIIGTTDINEINDRIRESFTTGHNLNETQKQNAFYNETSDIRFFELSELESVPVWDLVRAHVFSNNTDW